MFPKEGNSLLKIKERKPETMKTVMNGTSGKRINQGGLDSWRTKTQMITTTGQTERDNLELFQENQTQNTNGKLTKKSE